MFSLDWLKKNAVILSLDNLNTNSFFAYVWCISKHQLDELFRTLTDSKDDYVVRPFQERVYISTPRGLVIAINATISNSDKIKYKDCNILRPEINRDGIYAPSSRYATWMKGYTTESIVQKQKEFVEKDRKEKEEAAAIMAKRKAVELKYRSHNVTDTEFQALVTTALNFDHHFEYSDDHRYCINTRARLRDIEKHFTEYGFVGKEVMEEIYKAYS